MDRYDEVKPLKIKITELQASLEQAASDKSVPESDIRDQHKVQLEGLYDIKSKYHSALRNIGKLQEDLEEVKEEGRKRGLKVDQFHNTIQEHAKVNLLLKEQLDEAKKINKTLVEEKVDMQKGVDKVFESLRENHKEQEARLEERHAEELAQKGRQTEVARGLLKEVHGEALRQKDQQTKDQIEHFQAELRKERARKVARPSAEQKPDETEVNALKTRLNDVLRQSAILKGQRDAANRNNTLIIDESEAARATMRKQRDTALEQVIILNKELTLARGAQKALDTLQEQHEAARSKISDLEIALQQAREATQALQEKLDQNEPRSALETANAAVMRQSAIVEDLEQALAKGETQKEVSELQVKTLESEQLLNTAVDNDLKKHLLRQHQEEVFALKVQIPAPLPSVESESVQKKTKRKRGNKVRKLVYSVKESLWHARFKGADYQRGMVGFGSEKPHPLSEIEIDEIETSILLEQNDDASVVGETLDDSSLEPTAAVSMIPDINYDQYTSGEPDNVLLILGIPVVESTTLSNVMDSSTLGSLQVDHTTVAAKLSTSSTRFFSPSRNFWCFFIWFFIMALQWLSVFEPTIANQRFKMQQLKSSTNMKISLPPPVSQSR